MRVRRILLSPTGQSGRERLERLHRWPKLREPFLGQVVVIWSGEHEAWWRANGGGYTTVEAEAGLYSFEDAWRRSQHCGPEKCIQYHLMGVRLATDLPLVAWELEVNGHSCVVYAASAAKAKWRAVKSYWEAYDRRDGWPPISIARAPFYDRAFKYLDGAGPHTPEHVRSLC